MSKNRTRGKPKKKANKVRDSNILAKMGADIDFMLKKGVQYLSKNKKKLITV